VGDFAYVARPGISARVDSVALLLAKSWGAPIIVWDDAGPRSLADSRFLQTAAHLSGVPATTVFLAGQRREEPTNPREFTWRAVRVLADLGMIAATHHDGATDEHRTHQLNEHARNHIGTVVARRDVVTSQRRGAWFPLVKPLHQTYPNEAIGTMTDESGRVDSLRATTFGLVLHQRFAGPVPPGTALVIIGIMPDPRTRRTP
jgi:predicted deacylase